MGRKLSEYDRQNIKTQRHQQWETFDHETAGYNHGRGMSHGKVDQEDYQRGARIFGVKYDQGGNDVCIAIENETFTQLGQLLLDRGGKYSDATHAGNSLRIQSFKVWQGEFRHIEPEIFIEDLTEWVEKYKRLNSASMCVKDFIKQLRRNEKKLEKQRRVNYLPKRYVIEKLQKVYGGRVFELMQLRQDEGTLYEYNEIARQIHVGLLLASGKSMNKVGKLVYEDGKPIGYNAVRRIIRQLDKNGFRLHRLYEEENLAIRSIGFRNVLWYLDRAFQLPTIIYGLEMQFEQMLERAIDEQKKDKKVPREDRKFWDLLRQNA